jgi:hypothetical protein
MRETFSLAKAWPSFGADGRNGGGWGFSNWLVSFANNHLAVHRIRSLLRLHIGGCSQSDISEKTVVASLRKASFGHCKVDVDRQMTTV